MKLNIYHRPTSAFALCAPSSRCAVAMVKFLKEKKVVIVLNGRYAGKKAVIIDTFEKYASPLAALISSLSLCNYSLRFCFLQHPLCCRHRQKLSELEALCR